MGGKELNRKIRLRDGQTEVIFKYTSFLEGRSLPDRLEWIMMDYQRTKEAKETRDDDRLIDALQAVVVALADQSHVLQGISRKIDKILEEEQ